MYNEILLFQIVDPVKKQHNFSECSKILKKGLNFDQFNFGPKISKGLRSI